MVEVSEDAQDCYHLEMLEAGRILKTLGKCSTYLRLSVPDSCRKHWHECGGNSVLPLSIGK